MILLTVRLYGCYEFKGIKQDGFAILFRKPTMVIGKSNDALRGPYELFDVRTMFHNSCYT